MPDPGTHRAVGGVVVFIARQRGPVAPLWRGTTKPVLVGAVPRDGHTPAACAHPGGRQASASARVQARAEAAGLTV